MVGRNSDRISPHSDSVLRRYRKSYGSAEIGCASADKSLISNFYGRRAAAVRVTFTAVIADAKVRGALVRVVVPPAEGTRTTKPSFPKAMAETEASLLSTVTAQVAVFVASLSLVTVIVVVPTARAVTKPVPETLATEGTELT